MVKVFPLLRIKFIQALEPEDKIPVCNYSTNMIAKLESFPGRLINLQNKIDQNFVFVDELQN